MRDLYEILVISTCMALIFGCSNQADQLNSGDIARDFQLNSITHERFYLNEHKGKVTVLVFWATWCVICKEELIDLKALAKTEKSENLVIAGICTDPQNTANMNGIIRNLGIDYTILLDKGAALYSIYKIKVLPTTVIIDRDLRIALVNQGYDSLIKRQIKTKVEVLLSHQKVN